ncbi:MAG: serine/threonine-protein kinase [Gemmataceae bacterium]
MLVGQQLGPFLIEKELGAGAMGAVYLGKYTKTGQRVAIKVMAPGLGANALARFDREANILKQLNHPNIVRLFGIGKHRGQPYYAMEYVQGESLDRVMARRDRMSWEEVVDLGSQLCAALQHAHEAGIVHRDLKPSNLMILPDGTLKLTDFGIAKDLDVTGLTGANCTVGTAAYMSPEQCRGDRDITYKSDLYSLGVVFFELITGRKPFIAESAMDMFMLHVNAQPPRPSRLALDVPVWLDTLICQLLEKTPDHRPRDAEMVAKVLSSIQEKVEAQQAAGIDAVRATVGDGKRAKLTDEDRDAARSLMGSRKGGKKKKKKEQQRRWEVVAKAAGLILLLVGIVVGVVVAKRPASADPLYAKCERMMTAVAELSDKPERRDRAREKLEEARDGPIQEYLTRYADGGDRAKQVRVWADAHDAARYEELLHKYLRYRRNPRGIEPQANTDGEKLAFKAAALEYDGERDEAAKLWRQLLELEGSTRLGVVAARHLAAFAALDAESQRLAALGQEVRDRRVEPKVDGPEALAFLAFRQEALGDLAGARVRLERLRESTTGKDADDRFWQVFASVMNHRVEQERFWQLYAATRIRALTDRLKEKPQDDRARVALLQKAVAEARTAFDGGTGSQLDQRRLAQDVITLYADDPDLATAVKAARELRALIDQKLPPG